MKAFITIILSVVVVVAVSAQSMPLNKSAQGKRNSVRSIYRGRIDRHIPTEGDGTGDRILGEKSKRVKNVYNAFIRKRQNFAQRRYSLKTSGGEPIKPSVKR
jgi:hypothetical protein